MEVFIILVLILLNGVLSMSEIALVSARKTKLETAAKKGSQAAKAALKLSETSIFSCSCAEQVKTVPPIIHQLIANAVACTIFFLMPSSCVSIIFDLPIIL